MAGNTAFWLSLLAAAATSLFQGTYADAAPRVLGLQFSKHDARDLALPSGGLQRRATTVDATIANAQGSILYLVNVTVGTPPQSLGLQLDTGSSDVWLPYVGSSACERKKRCSNGAYDPAQSSTYNLLKPGLFQIEYVDGTKIQGDYISDNFGINGSIVRNMTLGTARKSSDDGGGIFQGIIGVGFDSGEAIASQTGQTYPNILRVLKQQGVIATQAYSLWLNDLKSSEGTVLFGGIDEAKYHGDLSILPIQPDAGTNVITTFTVTFDNIVILGVNGSTQYNKQSLSIPVILDSGTTMTYLPDHLVNDINFGVGAVQSKVYGTLVPCELMNTQAVFRFGFGNPTGPVIEAPISEFVVPFPPDTKAPKLRHSKKTLCRWGILPSGNDPNLFGDTFLRSAYVVYNLDGKQIGIAQANFNATGSNIKEITQVSRIPNAVTTISEVPALQTATAVTQQATPATFTATASTTEMLDQQPTATFQLGKPTAAYPGDKSAGVPAIGVKAPSTVLAAVFAVLLALF